MRYLTLIKKPVAKIGFVGYFYRQNPQSVMHQKRSRMSVIMSIDASSNVGEAISKIGIIPDKSWLTAFAVTTFLFIMSRENNQEVYDELQTRFPVKSFIKVSICHGSRRVKGAAFLYSILGRSFFYKVASLFYRLKCTLNK